MELRRLGEEGRRGEGERGVGVSKRHDINVPHYEQGRGCIVAQYG